MSVDDMDSHCDGCDYYNYARGRCMRGTCWDENWEAE